MTEMIVEIVIVVLFNKLTHSAVLLKHFCLFIIFLIYLLFFFFFNFFEGKCLSYSMLKALPSIELQTTYRIDIEKTQHKKRDICLAKSTFELQKKIRLLCIGYTCCS